MAKLKQQVESRSDKTVLVSFPWSSQMQEVIHDHNRPLWIDPSMTTGGFFLEISRGTGAYILPSPASSCPAEAPSTSSPLVPHLFTSEVLSFPSEHLSLSLWTQVYQLIRFLSSGRKRRAKSQIYGSSECIFVLTSGFVSYIILVFIFIFALLLQGSVFLL